MNLEVGVNILKWIERVIYFYSFKDFVLFQNDSIWEPKDMRFFRLSCIKWCHYIFLAFAYFLLVWQKCNFPSPQRDPSLQHLLPWSDISGPYYWRWQGSAASVVLVCCLTGFNILAFQTGAACACVRGVSFSLKKKKKARPSHNLLGNNEAISWLKVEKLPPSNPHPPLSSPLSAGLHTLREVRNLARCAKCLWCIITEGVLDLACLPPHLVACCLRHIPPL